MKILFLTLLIAFYSVLGAFISKRDLSKDYVLPYYDNQITETYLAKEIRELYKGNVEKRWTKRQLKAWRNK